MKSEKLKMQLLKVMILLFAVLFMHSCCCVSAEDLLDEVKESLRRAWNEENVEISVDLVQDELDDFRKQEALGRLKKILGIHGKLKEQVRDEVATPQFMLELYNAVTDSTGKTRERNPYNAKVVRSFIEKGGTPSHLYIFNPIGLEEDEFVLEAELHLYRKHSSTKSMHPSVITSPYYLIKVYQVLPDKSLDVPDFHRLLNVHYVGAFASGWQVFNVKQAVISWLSGAPNLGLLISASTIFGDDVTVEFHRRDNQFHDKQPILVLFNGDNNDRLKAHHEEQRSREGMSMVDDDDESTSDELENEMVESERSRSKRNDNGGEGQKEEVPTYLESSKSTYYQRVKKDRKHRQRDENDVERPTRRRGFVANRKSLEQTLTSMDIYQRAMLREKLQSESKNSESPSLKYESRFTRSLHGRSKRVRRATECRKVDPEPCAKRELYVNFREIGLTEIIAPEGYQAYQCRGHCKSPLSQDQKPTNHATIQGIVHKMNLTPSQGVEMPCCVPVNLSSISILYHERDDDRDGVVLKSYTDMVVGSCGCR